MGDKQPNWSQLERERCNRDMQLYESWVPPEVDSQIERCIAFVNPYKSCGTMYNAGHVLAAIGEVMSCEMESVGRDLDEWVIEEVPPVGTIGILTWEGQCTNMWSRHHGGEWEPELKGKWRHLTDDEWKLLVPIVNPEQGAK